ncbi:DoxX family membrane protein [Reichenbachiella agarivorans]|uniref:DoxX family membrane protein n=1 Tax=Reichenbachiella agarivorans TaxID=2979464 RepID=A0ABY6CT31_9BACT|nr:DoxX family membrane protein [Reichenbachiella agarivorans]UXP33677.1 DoxX family membrane protein [Reichenbachiella agarivorans]
MKEIIIVIIRIALGALLVYGGVNKFIPKAPRPSSTEVSTEVPDHVIHIKAFIGGLKQSGYFWPFLGIAEIVCGLLLISQVLSLMGAVMTVPITLNIFLFHLFLEPHDLPELLLTGLCLAANISLLAYDYHRLKWIFIPNTIKL